jgi:hypothetical protein
VIEGDVREGTLDLIRKYEKVEEDAIATGRASRKTGCSSS